MRRRLAAVGAVLLGLGLLLALWPLPQELARPRQEASLRILDRNGELLREVPSSQNGVSRWVGVDEVAPALVQATVEAEDRRFWYHPGVDPLAVARSLWINLRAGRVLTGGSTLTQQLVRNLRPLPGAGAGSKVLEALYAVRMELRFSKREILEFYLNRVPYGNGTYGVEAASQLYFEKPAAHLSAAEAAFLAVIPRAPGDLDPYWNPDEVRSLQQALLRRMGAEGFLDEEGLRLALEEEIVPAPLSERFGAPHFVDRVLAGLPRVPGAQAVRTTLDLEVQGAAEDLLRGHLRRLQDHGVGNGAVVVLDVATGDVLAMVGSRDYYSPDGGQVNGATALRQPGSTLKPFTYELALERGMTAATLLADVDFQPTAEGGFVPRNYDWTNHGPVRARTALACSYNISAVRALDGVGVNSLLERLRALGLRTLDRDASYYGLGLTLGDGEVTLLDLAGAYRALARGGVAGPVREVLEVVRPDGRGGLVADPVPPRGPDRQVCDPRATFVVTDILADPEARTPAFGRHGPLALPFDCAAKTGTSKAYRDNWTVGFTPRYVVGVWVGNFDGRSMVNVSGITGAGPLFRDMMLFLSGRDRAQASPRAPEPAFAPPRGLERADVCAASGERVGPDCAGAVREWFLPGSEPRTSCSVHRRVAGRVYEVFPPLYRSWMAEVGLPVPPAAAGGRWVTRPAEPEEGSPRLEEPVAEAPPPVSRLRVAYPEDGAAFRRDPVLRKEYQTVLLRAEVPEEVDRVEWRVDGKVLARVSTPYTVRWPLEPGLHRLEVAAPGQAPSTITVTVW